MSSDEEVLEIVSPVTSSEKDTGKEPTEPYAKEPEGPGRSEESPSSIPEAQEELSDEEEANTLEILDDDQDLNEEDEREMVFTNAILVQL